MSNDTPRTDACIKALTEYRSLAKELERELATLRERLAEREAEVGRYMMANNTLGEKLAEADHVRKRDCALVTEYQKRAQQAEQRAERAEKDAERYRFLRDDDNWCDDGPITWEALGECSGTDFDAFVQAKMTEAYYADPANQKQGPVDAEEKP